jgi:hypothetical protein
MSVPDGKDKMEKAPTAEGRKWIVNDGIRPALGNTIVEVEFSGGMRCSGPTSLFYWELGDWKHGPVLERWRCVDPASPAPESDPAGRPAHEPGAKLDAGKSPVRRGLLEYFPRACLAVAQVSAFGAEKYIWGGWRAVPNGVDRYGDAEVRHICDAAIGGPVTADSQLLHATHEAWNALARLELILSEKEPCA